MWINPKGILARCQGVAERYKRMQAMHDGAVNNINTIFYAFNEEYENMAAKLQEAKERIKQLEEKNNGVS